MADPAVHDRSSWAPAVPGEPAVACDGLRKAFGSLVANDEVTLEVQRGEILALLGPSGCGKTTFLRLLAGFERPDAGTIRMAGRVVASDGVFVPPERRQVGVVFQDYALFPHMTVAENVGYGVRRGDRDARVQEVLSLVGLSGLGPRSPHDLSGGQQQRVALARALAHSPTLVLLDEPFSNLDAALRSRVRDEVREILRRAEATAIFVTHDQEEALSLADRVGIMRGGRVLQVDTPERVYTRPADPFVAAFVGGANVLQARGDGREVRSCLGTHTPLNPAPDGPALLCVRPESVHLRLDAEGPVRVERTTFYGHDQVLDLVLPDGTRLRSRLGPGRFFGAGDRVRIEVTGDEILAFPEPRA